jgi:hypothetical protein
VFTSTSRERIHGFKMNFLGMFFAKGTTLAGEPRLDQGHF